MNINAPISKSTARFDAFVVAIIDNIAVILIPTYWWTALVYNYWSNWSRWMIVAS
jgi:hypothetical protein